LLSDLGNHTYYIPGPHGNLNKLPDPAPVARVEAETKFAMGAVVMGEETLDEVPTAAAGERRHDGECELDELPSADESATGDETINNDQVFEDAASHKSLDDGFDDVGLIPPEKRGDGRIYLIHGTVTEMLLPYQEKG
jgi:hypothetical protein